MVRVADYMPLHFDTERYLTAGWLMERFADYCGSLMKNGF